MMKYRADSVDQERNSPIPVTKFGPEAATPRRGANHFGEIASSHAAPFRRNCTESAPLDEYDDLRRS
jgi:hypothetical protein